MAAAQAAPPAPQDAGAAASDAPAASARPLKSANSELLAQVQADIALIKAHPIFAGIQLADPIGIREADKPKAKGKAKPRKGEATIVAEPAILSGHKSSFNTDDCRMALQGAGVYDSSCNLFWLDMLASPTSSPQLQPIALGNICSDHWMQAVCLEHLALSS